MPPPKKNKCKANNSNNAKQHHHQHQQSNKSRRVPVNWPAQLAYYTTPQLSPALGGGGRARGGALTPAAPSALVRIRRIARPDHPAHGQHGLFATRTLAAGAWVLDYVGFCHTLAESDPASDYDLVVDREGAGLAVDAARGGNEARFVNDFRGVAERPNMVFAPRVIPAANGGGGGGGGQEPRMALWVGPAPVRKGDELLVSYGKGFWNERRREAQ